MEEGHRKFYDSVAIKTEENDDFDEDSFDRCVNNPYNLPKSPNNLLDTRKDHAEKNIIESEFMYESKNIVKQEKVISENDEQPTLPMSLESKREKRLNEDLRVAELFKMHCDLCDQKFLNFSEARQHYRLHKVNGYLRCCNKKFIRRQQVVDHVNWHWNPSLFE